MILLLVVAYCVFIGCGASIIKDLVENKILRMLAVVAYLTVMLLSLLLMITMIA